MSNREAPGRYAEGRGTKSENWTTIFVLIALLVGLGIFGLVQDFRHRSEDNEVRAPIVALENPDGSLSPSSGYEIVLRDVELMDTLEGVRIVTGIQDHAAANSSAGVVVQSDEAQYRSVMFFDDSGRQVAPWATLRPDGGGSGGGLPGMSLVYVVADEVTVAVVFGSAGRREIPIYRDSLSDVRFAAIVASNGEVLHGIQLRDADGDLVAAMSSG